MNSRFSTGLSAVLDLNGFNTFDENNSNDIPNQLKKSVLEIAHSCLSNDFTGEIINIDINRIIILFNRVTPVPREI